jgi:branched-chain amino acid aminotransferase
MLQFSIVNGNLFETSKATLPARDLSILRGYAVFDYFRIQEGVPLFLEDYLDRFIRSANGLRLQFEWSKGDLRKMIFELILANHQIDGGIRMILTGGCDASGYSIAAANLLMISYPHVEYPLWYFEKGIKAVSVQHQRELPHIKSINYLSGIYHRLSLEAHSAQYLLYHDGIYVRESDRYNIFFVDQDNVLITPEQKVLHGVTRKQILELASKNGIPCECREIAISEIPNMKETFFSSTTIGGVPIRQIDDLQIGSGLPGPVYRQVQSLFEERCKDYVASNRQ